VRCDREPTSEAVNRHAHLPFPDEYSSSSRT
jgi:hypothetical protein